MKIDQKRLVSEFQALVSIDSKSFGEKEMGQYLVERLDSLGFTVSQDDAGERLGGNCGNIRGFLAGTDGGEPLLFCAHMDTVEPSAGKRAILGADGVIKSGGDTVLGADDCAGLAAILEALESIRTLGLPHPPIEILFTVAEEAYCRGVAEFDLSKIVSREAYVLDLDGPVGRAAYRAPTILSFAVEVIGKSSHAGFAPEEGVHAVAAAAKAVSSLHMGRIDGETTLNIGFIQGGGSSNIVPDRCRVTGEIRSSSHQRALELADEVEKCFADSAATIGATTDFRSHLHFEAYQTPRDHAVVRRFERICRELSISPSLLQTFGGSDNHYLAKHGIRGIVIANAMNKCHSREEYTSVDELCRIAEITLSLMTAAC